MNISRRDFVHAGCSAIAASLVPNALQASIHGSVISTVNNSRVTINAVTGFLNLAKGFGFNIDPNNQSSDGYPVSAPSGGTFGANPSFPLGYYGQFVWKWANTGAMSWPASPPLIVTASTVNGSNSPVLFELPAGTGDIGPGNKTFIGQGPGPGLNTPRLVFSAGWNIQSISDSGISNGAGGTFIKITTKSNFNNGVGNQTAVNVSGAASNTGANDVWSTVSIDASNFYLATSQTTGLPSAFTNAQASAAGTSIFAPQNQSINFSSNGFGTFSGMDNLVICKSADESAIAGGQIVDGQLISQLQQLMGTPGGVGRGNPGWLRFMDLSGVQGSYESDFSQRIPASYLSYQAANFRPGYWINTITNGGSDAYTCANPSNSPASGPYVDNEIVQGIFNTTNTGGNPTLNVGGRGAKPIIDSHCDPVIFRISGPPASAGLSMVFTFSASWLNSGSPHALTYVTNSGATFTGSTSGSQMTVTGFSGSPLNVNTVFSSPQGNFIITAFGTGTGGNGTYTVVGGNGNALSGNACSVTDDTSSSAALNGNLVLAFGADATLSAGKIVFGNSAQVVAFPRTAQAGRLAVTYTSGPAICTMITLDAGTLGGDSTLIYNYLLDGWIYEAGGLIQSIPLEYIAEMCNRVGTNCWFNWGITKGAWITAVTNFFATNLNAGLKFGQEPGNELWNPSANPFAEYQSLGFTLGFPNGSDVASYSYGALRILQYNALAKSAWTGAGRSALDLWVLQPSATFDVSVNGNFDVGQMKGSFLNRTGGTLNGVPNNPIYGAFGGLNGSGAVTTDFNIFPNRPVDITRATGCAPYWSSHWLGNGGSIADASAIVGTVTQNAPWLQAAKDYVLGNTATAFTSMANQFTEVTPGGSGNGGFDFVDMQSVLAREEALCAQYDGARPSGMPNLIIMDYECGPSWGVGANGINGINSVNSADISAIANRITALGWDVSPFTQSGTNNATEMATMAIEMFQGWKFDTTITGAAANTGSYKNMIKTSYYAARNQQNTNREAHAAQFNFGGPGQWGLFPGSYTTGIPYTSFNAIAEFND